MNLLKLSILSERADVLLLVEGVYKHGTLPLRRVDAPNSRVKGAPLTATTAVKSQSVDPGNSTLPTLSVITLKIFAVNLERCAFRAQCSFNSLA